jgi:hypothetical protein
LEKRPPVIGKETYCYWKRDLLLLVFTLHSIGTELAGGKVISGITAPVIGKETYCYWKRDLLLLYRYHRSSNITIAAYPYIYIYIYIYSRLRRLRRLSRLIALVGFASSMSS